MSPEILCTVADRIATVRLNRPDKRNALSTRLLDALTSTLHALERDAGVRVVGVAVAAGNAHCVRSWVPKGRHPVRAAEGCGPQVRELGLRGAGNHVVRPLLAQPGGRRKASPLGSRP